LEGNSIYCKNFEFLDKISTSKVNKLFWKKILKIKILLNRHRPILLFKIIILYIFILKKIKQSIIRNSKNRKVLLERTSETKERISV
jgi:hypothetical protein